MCLATYFEHFVFMELFDLNSSLNNLFEGSSILVDFSVNFLICLCISFIVLKILRSFSSGLILINSQLSSFSIDFCLFISWSIFLPL